MMMNSTPNSGKITPTMGNGASRVMAKANAVQKTPKMMPMTLPTTPIAEGPRPGLMLRT